MNSLHNQRLVLRSNMGVQFVLKAELIYLKANGSYTNIYVLKDGEVKCYVQSGNLAVHEANLNENFLRISKSCIVNINFVEHIFNDRTVKLTVAIAENLVISIRYWKKIRRYL